MWEEPEEVVEPITLDRMNFGNLVHHILARTVRAMEERGGFCSVAPSALKTAVAAAAKEAAVTWELEKPIPPQLVWRGTVAGASEAALAALQVGEEPLPEQRTWVEVPFGRDWVEADGGRIPGIRLHPSR